MEGALWGSGIGSVGVEEERVGGFHPAAEDGYPFRHETFPETLRGLYDRYCEAEAAELLSLVPRSSLRDFLRNATVHDAAAGRGPIPESSFERSDELSHDDALAKVRRYARSILPLPPYEVWVRSYLENRAPFLERLGIASSPRSEEPVMVAIREFGEGWYAALYLSNAEDEWRGSIHFHRSEGVRSYRTADIFREEDPEEIRARFIGFDITTLQAFLRSVLP